MDCKNKLVDNSLAAILFTGQESGNPRNGGKKKEVFEGSDDDICEWTVNDQK